MTENQQRNLPYLPHTDEERLEMLRAIGVSTFEELVKHIPERLRAKPLSLKDGLSEQELSKEIASLAAKNEPVSSVSSFLGGGSYRRYVPAMVPAMVSRGEFSTAYTPYQPEVSQGTLQAIYEFQTAICVLTGMEVANASMYDGPTACAEAAMMACRLTGRNKVVLSKAVNPEYRMVTRTYAESAGIDYEETPLKNGLNDAPSLSLGGETACFIMQYPNYFGLLENPADLAGKAHKEGALLVVVSEPISLGMITPPGELDADIVVGDAQPCGNSLSFGGPSAGYMACRKDYIRQLPGRLVGITQDNRGQRAFTLTLQTREQHIRRAKATSNICTNQALNALTMLVYLTSVGPRGLRELCRISTQRAHYLFERLEAIDGVVSPFKSAPFFNEFVIKSEIPTEKLLDELKKEGILGGIDLSRFYDVKDHPELHNAILVAVTEMNSKEELDRYVDAMASIKSKGEARKNRQNAEVGAGR